MEILWANRPTSPSIGDTINVSDADVETIALYETMPATPIFGLPIIGGGGTWHILARWNGSNWTVSG